MKVIFSSKTVRAIGAAIALEALVACSSMPMHHSTSASSPPSNPTSDMHPSSMGHGMDLGPADAEFDLRFIDSMIPHHEGAVDMAKEALQKSKRAEVKKLAQDMITAQAEEIAQMQQWRKTWYPKATATPVAWHTGMNHSMAMSKEQVQAMKMSMDLGAADSQFDLRFINAMIPHHEGALTMAQEAAKKSKRSEVQTLAKAIATSQQVEIAQMQQWRKTWNNLK